MSWGESIYHDFVARGGKVKETPLAAPVSSVKQSPPIRQSSAGGPNKTELRFENDHLKSMRHTGEILLYRFASITLRLGNGVRYTPDYFSINGNGKVVFWEVKGARLEEDAIVKLKMAPAIFPEFEFYLCQWKNGRWSIDKVLP